MKITRIFLIACFPLLVHASSGNGIFQSIFDQFEQETVLQAELEIDFDLLEDNRKTNDYQSARFNFIAENGAAHNWEVEVRSRGRFRRKNCEMPPLRIKFSKDELVAKGFQKHNIFKLVTHCVEGAAGDELILREQLTYELYNLITPNSFRTQLVEITYKDRGSKKKITQYGILIEDTDMMAERLKGAECDECYNLKSDQFNMGELQVHALFQYMIGNTDWSVSMGRNLKLVQSSENGQFIAVPYDFDFSGLVNAHYALPNPDYKLESIRQRFFLGDLDQEQSLQSAIGYFIANKNTLLNHINSFELLSKRNRKDISNYVEQFYTEIESGSLSPLTQENID